MNGLMPLGIEIHAAKPRKPTYHRSRKIPQRPRTVQTLVVEPDRQRPAEPVDHREQVPLKAGPGILPPHAHPHLHPPHACAHVRHAVHRHQAVRTAPRNAQHPPNPVILEAAREDANARCVQCRTYRVPLVRPNRPPVELELDRPRTVDDLRDGGVQTWRTAIGTHCCLGRFSGHSVRTTRFVTVSRCATNHFLHPNEWCHHSALSPAAFSVK